MSDTLGSHSHINFEVPFVEEEKNSILEPFCWLFGLLIKCTMFYKINKKNKKNQ